VMSLERLQRQLKSLKVDRESQKKLRTVKAHP
jgi:hypothetical protein